MKLLFLQYQPFPYFGLMSLSGYLKRRGTDCQCLIAALEKDLLLCIRKINPDVIGFSALSTEYKWLRDTSRIVKENFKDKPVIAGGIHAMLYPLDLMEKNPWIDFVCTGEGEEALAELLSSLENNKNTLDIPGLFARSGAGIRRNDRRMPISSLDGFTEDREIYFSRYPDFSQDPVKQFLASRGCPYQCSFCANRALQGIFKTKGGNGFVRKKSPDTSVKEIEQVKGRYPLETVFFADDLFTADRNWLKYFCREYSQRINLPFMCVTRIDLIDEDNARLLKESGCYAVSVGIESGSEEIRAKILNKDLSDRAIIRGAGILKSHGIKLQTSNMFCIPTETASDAFKTVEFNIRIKTDFAFTAILMPFPGTRIAEIASESKLLDNGLSFQDLPMSFFSNSVLKLENKHILENIQRVAYLCIKFPAILPLARRLVRFRALNGIFYLIFHIGNFLRYKEERRLSLLKGLKYFYRFRKSL